MSEKTYSILIEETVSQSFEIMADSQEEALRIAEQKYNKAEIVLEPGNIVSVNFRISN